MGLYQQAREFVARFGPTAAFAIKHIASVAVPGSGAVVELIEKAIGTAAELAADQLESEAALKNLGTAEELERITEVLEECSGRLSNLVENVSGLHDQPDESIQAIIRSQMATDAEIRSGFARLGDVFSRFDRLEQQNRKILVGVGYAGDLLASLNDLMQRQLIVVEFVEELRAAGVQGRQLCGLSERMELIVSELREGKWQQAMPQLAEMKMACPQSAAVEEAIAIGEVLNNHPQQARAALASAAHKRPGDARLAALSRRVTLATRSKEVETGKDKPGDQGWQAHFHRGAVLDGWTITGQLGAGGGGMVFRIEKDDRVRAMKVLPAELSNDPAFAAQFRQEILTLRGLSKLKHIVQFHDFNRHLETGCWYFQMEYVEGESLQTRLDRQGTIPFDDALQMVLQLASDEGLGAVHAQNLCHRDIKPGNILLRPDGTAVLVDFGVAGSASATLTSATSITGFTAKFAAPEQLRHQPATTASDVFSLMGTFWYAVTGEFPEEFEADEMPLSLRRLRSILIQALQPKPTRRMDAAQALYAWQ